MSPVVPLRSALAVALCAALVVGVAGTATARSPLLVERFDRPDRLITNSFATWNPGNPASVVDPTWGMSMGSLFNRGGAGWTGRPDPLSPDARSAIATGSAIFRLYSKRADLGDARVTVRIRPTSFVSSPARPAVATDGVHLWLRFVDDRELYVASVLRRDGAVVIKKKCRGGLQNGGTYHVIGTYRSGRPLPMGAWSTVAAAAVDVLGGVRLRLWQNGAVVLDVTDRGVGCAPIAAPGQIGVRADNTELYVDDLVVTSA